MLKVSDPQLATTKTSSVLALLGYYQADSLKNNTDRPENARPEPEVDRYEPPEIVWTEAYEPVGFGISCVLQEGNPGCLPGPILT